MINARMDEILRKLERRAMHGGAEEQAHVYRHLMRKGLCPASIKILAYLGDPAAIMIFPSEEPKVYERDSLRKLALELYMCHSECQTIFLEDDIRDHMVRELDVRIKRASLLAAHRRYNQALDDLEIEYGYAAPVTILQILGMSIQLEHYGVPFNIPGPNDETLESMRGHFMHCERLHYDLRMRLSGNASLNVELPAPARVILIYANMAMAPALTSERYGDIGQSARCLFAGNGLSNIDFLSQVRRDLQDWLLSIDGDSPDNIDSGWDLPHGLHPDITIIEDLDTYRNFLHREMVECFISNPEDTVTQIAEFIANDVIGCPEILDNPDHWIWEAVRSAFEEFEERKEDWED